VFGSRFVNGFIIRLVLINPQWYIFIGSCIILKEFRVINQ
jgi:hypothetical protein